MTSLRRPERDAAPASPLCAQPACVESEAGQFRRIVEDSLQGIVVHRGKPLYVNQALVNLLGLVSREEFLATDSVLDHIHPDDHALVREQMALRISGAAPVAHYDFRLRHRDGSTVWVHCTGQSIAWNGAPAAIASLYDITQRKRAEEALRRSEKLFVTVFHASPDMISLTTLRDGRYVDVNDSFLRMFGHERDQLIGRTAAEIGFWADPSFRTRLVDTLKRDGVVRDAETTARTKGGAIRHLTFSIEVIRFEQEELLLAVGRDITDRRRHEEELRQSKEAAELANRSKSEFLANMSHELRTPLNAILGFSEVIRDQLFGPIGTAQYADYANDINTSGQHLLQIINDLLDLSKLEAGKIELSEEELSLASVIEDCLRLVRGRAGNVGVALKVVLPPELPGLRADGRLLKQILINLLSNAVKFTPPAGTITVGAAVLPGRLELSVADTGIGMDAEGIAVALTAFGQVDSSLTRAHQGTGLGLPIARSLARLHGGDLTIDSALGRGTTVRVSLPACRLVNQPSRFSNATS
jgi:two-component system, cell cycle sensor histidine kinase PleC